MSDKKPFFSIIIPCYKAEDTIAQAIGSVLDQDFKDYEIICVLDGPDETTEAIVRSFPGVKCEVIEHAGAPAARNKGFALSSGSIVIFSDSDVYWNPGVFRKFNELFSKEPDLAFAYGGYRWTDMDGAHVPHDFDPYLLTVTNYIDTGNPVRREWVDRIGGWDESLARWQDWDFWLRIVKLGGKGKRLEEITRQTDFPKKGSISGTDNYAPTYHVVKKKHGIPSRDVCVTSIAAHDHGLRIAKMCGWDYWHNPGMLPNDYKAIYLLGMFPESVNDHISLFMDQRTRERRKDTAYVIHWIGTDILHMRTMLPFLQIRQLRIMFEKYNVVHLFQTEENAEEMRELGFKGEVLPLPVENKFEIYPMPKNFTVAVYDHGGIDEKWHKWVVMEIAKAMPHVRFLFFGNKHAVGSERNTTWLGKQPIQDIIRQSSALLRLTIHDGFPVAPVEFMFSGRRVITNVPGMPFTDYVNLGVVTDDRVVEIKKMIFDKIEEVRKGPGVNPKAIPYYEKILAPLAFKEKLNERIEDALKKIRA